MTQDYRWHSRNTDGGYFPDFALEALEDNFSWDEMEPTDITDRAIAWFKSQ